MKRLCIPLPEVMQEKEGNYLMSREQGCLCEEETELAVQRLGGFLGADMTQLCRGVPLGPIHSL